MKKEKLTEEQRDFIKKNIGNLSIVQISERLGLNYRTVWYYASKNTDIKKHHKFTEEEDQFIIESYNNIRADNIAESLGLTRSNIYNRARKLKVRKFTRN